MPDKVLQTAAGIVLEIRRIQVRAPGSRVEGNGVPLQVYFRRGKSGLVAKLQLRGIVKQAERIYSDSEGALQSIPKTFPNFKVPWPPFWWHRAAVPRPLLLLINGRNV